MKIVIPLFSTEIESTLQFYIKLGFDSRNNLNLFNEDFGLQINIYEATNEKLKSLVGRQGADFFLFSIQIDGDIELLKIQLLEKGLDIYDHQSVPFGEYLYLKDPNGNKICFYQNII